MASLTEYLILSDARLVELAREGDAAAFEHLVSRYRGALSQLYLQRTGGNRLDADDLLQETLVKIYLNLHRYDPGYTFGQWAYTIARNTFIDYVRKRREDLSIDNLPAGQGNLAPVSAEATPEEHYINTQQRHQLDGYLQRMNARYRRLIELRFYREFSYEEIAAELRIPLGTVKTQINRARKQLIRLIIAGDMIP